MAEAQVTEIGCDILAGFCCAPGSAWCAGTREQLEPGSSILPTLPCGGTTLPPLVSMQIHLGFLIHFVYKVFWVIPVLITQRPMSGPSVPSQCCQSWRMRMVSSSLLSWLSSTLPQSQGFSLPGCKSYHCAPRGAEGLVFPWFPPRGP